MRQVFHTTIDGSGRRRFFVDGSETDDVGYWLAFYHGDAHVISSPAALDLTTSGAKNLGCRISVTPNGKVWM